MHTHSLLPTTRDTNTQDEKVKEKKFTFVLCWTTAEKTRHSRSGGGMEEKGKGKSSRLS